MTTSVSDQGVSVVRGSDGGRKGAVRTDVLVDIRGVECLYERLLLIPGDRVHFEVAADKELTSHLACGDVGWSGRTEEGGR